MAFTDSIARTPGSGLLIAAVRLAGMYLDLAKARLSTLVLVTAAVGYSLATDGPMAWGTLLWMLLGTSLIAAGANGLNQCIEAPADGRMSRTQNRPLVSLRIGLPHACLVSTAWGVLGVVILSSTVNRLTALLGAAAILIYILAYTPLKQRTSICTLVGAVVGSIPPLMGAAAAGRLTTGAWILGAILFIWQIPHSLALAWLYREDYARGGYRLLIDGDASGRRTFRMIVVCCLALLPVSEALVLAGVAGAWYGTGAILLGLVLLGSALQLCRTAAEAWARRLFLATVVYLPILLALLLADPGPGR